MAEAFVLEGKILLDAQKVMSDLDKVDNKAEETGNTFDKIGSKLGGFSKALDKHVTNALKIGGVALAGFGVKAIDMASDLDEVQNVVDVTFGDGASVIDEWANSAGEAFGMSVLQAKQFNGTMGAMLKSMGLTSDETLNMSQAMVGLSGDMASFYNLPIEQAFDKIRSGISGETEPLKQLGINMSVANLEAYALAQGISKPYAKMSQSEQTLLRYNYLMNVTADAQGDFVRTGDSFANQVKKAQMKLSELTAEIGQKLLPYALKFITWVSDNIDKLPLLVGLFGGLLITIKGFLVVTQIAEAIKKWKKITEGMTLSQAALNLVMKANPIGIFITIIAALVAAIIYLWNTNEEFRVFIIGMWEGIKIKFTEFSEWLNGIFTTDWAQSFGFLGDIINGFLANGRKVLGFISLSNILVANISTYISLTIKSTLPVATTHFPN